MVGQLDPEPELVHNVPSLGYAEVCLPSDELIIKGGFSVSGFQLIFLF